MNSILTTLLLLTIQLTIFAQGVRVDTLYFQKINELKHFEDDSYKFPIIKTGNFQIDSNINTDLKNRVTNNKYPHLSTDSTFLKLVNDKIVYLDFEVTYFKNGLISLSIISEWWGVMNTNWKKHFTYNYQTGQYVTIDQVIDTTGKIRNLVFSDRDKQYKQNAEELKVALANSGIDKGAIELLMEEYGNCSKYFHFNSFALYEDHLEIVENCELSIDVKDHFTPIGLKYKYTDIKYDLKINN